MVELGHNKLCPYKLHSADIFRRIYEVPPVLEIQGKEKHGKK